MNKAAIMADNRNLYAEIYDFLNWPDPATAAQAEQERAGLLEHLKSSGVSLGYGDTKLDCRSLSPGCTCCAEGTWSCLFINGICNCRCFYCPTGQEEKGVPTTSSLTFPKVADYLSYLEYFNFKGVGLSGGEPLLTPETTLLYLGEIKKKFAHTLHVWLYTNGTLLTPPLLQQLQAAGLDEIRFDISANGYDVEKIRLAASYIPVITVEIPAIPEDYTLLCSLLRPLKEAGLKHLNLHQMRVTPQNYRAFLQRNYTFLHGLKLSILESELTALKVMKYNQEHAIGLPINYCSSIYRNRFQAYAARKRFAEEIRKPYETLTETGLIRSLWLQGSEEHLERLTATLTCSGRDPSLWLKDKTTKTLFFHPDLAPLMNLPQSHLALGARYHIARALNQVTYRNAFKEIPLPTGKKVIVERQVASPELLWPEQLPQQLFLDTCLNLTPPSAATLATLRQNLPEAETVIDSEWIPQGLQEYF